MLIKQLGIKEAPKLLDATDALAVALCHHYQFGSQASKSTSWNTFIKENPGRLK
jgi:crossover junction endodeoxyribonuclease RuvC